jgi:hypothetical protein
MPLLINFASTSATFTALTLASGKMEVTFSTPGSLLRTASMADASRTGLLTEFLFSFPEPFLNEFVYHRHAKWDILSHERLRPANCLRSGFDPQVA